VDDIIVISNDGVNIGSVYSHRPTTPSTTCSTPGPSHTNHERPWRHNGHPLQVVQEVDVESAGPTAWTSHSPVVDNVVTEILTRDTATAQADPSSGLMLAAEQLPAPFGFSRTVHYTYRDPAFDRWRRQLVGFRKVAVRTGDDAAVTETTYWMGPCENANLTPSKSGTTIRRRRTAHTRATTRSAKHALVEPCGSTATCSA